MDTQAAAGFTNLHRDPLQDDYEFDPAWERERAEFVRDNTELAERHKDAVVLLIALDRAAALAARLEAAETALRLLADGGSYSESSVREIARAALAAGRGG